MERTRRVLVGLLITCLAFLVAMGAVVGVEVTVRWIAIAFPREPAAALMLADSYRDTPWVREYSREMVASSDMTWHSYVYWRRRPYTGRFINIDSAGVRSTWASTNHRGTPLRVFLLGGSTVWGTGARDSETLASALARGLAARGFDPTVVNLGESGYVMHQDIAMLMSRLEQHDVPDIAVFYGPFNDIYSAFQNGVVGLPLNEANRQVEFNSLRVQNWRTALYIASAGIRSAARIVTSAERRRFQGALPDSAVVALAAGVVDAYCFFRRTVASLSHEYGFEAAFILQPTLYGKPSRTTSEARWVPQYPGLAALIAQSYAGMIGSKKACPSPIPVYDLSRTFERTTTPVFLDQIHLSENGNSVVAQEMLDTLLAHSRAVAQHGKRKAK